MFVYYDWINFLYIQDYCIMELHAMAMKFWTAYNIIEEGKYVTKTDWIDIEVVKWQIYCFDLRPFVLEIRVYIRKKIISVQNFCYRTLN